MSDFKDRALAWPSTVECQKWPYLYFVQLESALTSINSARQIKLHREDDDVLPSIGF
jgi:hypothetical protein